MNLGDYVAEMMSSRQLGDSSLFTRLGFSRDEALTYLNRCVRHFITGDLATLHIIDAWSSDVTCTLTDVDLPSSFRSILGVKSPRLGLLYGMPKLHKELKNHGQSLPDGFPFRMIGSMIEHPVSNLAKWVHRLLSPAMSRKYLPEYLRDTTDFVTTIDHVREMPENFPGISENSVPVVVDVDAMYPSTPWLKAAEAAASIWATLREDCYPEHPVSYSVIYNVVLFVMTHAVFSFNGEIFRQLHGITMGCSLSVVVANAFLSILLRKFFERFPHHASKIPLFRRYIDNVFLFFNGPQEVFEDFLQDLNSWSSSEGWVVQFSLPTSFRWKEPVQFLDTELYWNGGWHTRLFCKETDVHAYLLPTSGHPKHVFLNIPYGVALRIRRASAPRSMSSGSQRCFFSACISHVGVTVDLK